ncbi:hypothetical protein H4Q32_029489 [Labeo rohita]|uniref:Integrase zinc-binding domain-containing protein n=1 Tax=Labeo rohita TaxID=84645 RepID=A0ABQ8L0E7_LABRO|nr:hypothetical protein H4Q32_029489 [Labeo rohita]
MPQTNLEKYLQGIGIAVGSHWLHNTFTTQAKILVQDLWKIHLGWDDLIESDSLQTRWQTWVQELSELEQLEIPKCYTPFQLHKETFTRDLHIFCDASERAYGSVSYLRTEDQNALTGAQIAKVLQKELTVTIRQVILWKVSTTVLHWLLSDSCRYKVFVGTRVAKIQSLTDISSWSPDVQLPDADQYKTCKDLVKATVACLHGVAHSSTHCDEAKDYVSAERLLLQQAQRDSFPEEVKALSSNQPLPPNSQLVSLSPEYDEDTGLIRVGGSHAEHIDLNALHPIVLDPHQQLIKLLIKEYDANLLHPEPERVLAELRRHYWILRGRAAIKKCQLACTDCQRWRAQPKIPMMANLPPAHLRLYKPPFFSTGMDCFGQFTIYLRVATPCLLDVFTEIYS